MSKWDEKYQREVDLIQKERNTYALSESPILVFFEKLSFAFMAMGFIALISVFFTDVTLINATCFFVIGYTIMPTDGDRQRAITKGMAQDLANIRASTAIISKDEKSNKNTYKCITGHGVSLIQLLA